MNWSDGYAYFFRGDRYTRFHTVTNRVVGGSTLISAAWPGLQAHSFDRDLDSFLTWGNGFAYLLKGDRYLKYDMLGNNAVGEPHAIADGWPGLHAAGFHTGSKAAFCAPPPPTHDALLRNPGSRLAVAMPAGLRRE